MAEITVVGNLCDDVELRFTQSGVALGRIRVAENRRYTSGGEQKEETSFHTVVAWRELAENAAESLSKGDRVIVQGRLGQRQYQTEAGESRSVWEITAEAIGPDLRWASAQVTRNGRGGQNRPAPKQARPAEGPTNDPGDYDPYGPGTPDEPF